MNKLEPASISIQNGLITKRYNLMVNGKIVGLGGIRMSTTKAGDVVYKIFESERNHDYGNLMMRLLLEEAKILGKKKIIAVCRKSNIASKKIFEKNGGQMIKELKRKSKENRLVYQIEL